MCKYLFVKIVISQIWSDCFRWATLARPRHDRKLHFPFDYLCIIMQCGCAAPCPLKAFVRHWMTFWMHIVLSSSLVLRCKLVIWKLRVFRTITYSPLHDSSPESGVSHLLSQWMRFEQLFSRYGPWKIRSWPLPSWEYLQLTVPSVLVHRSALLGLKSRTSQSVLMVTSDIADMRLPVLLYLVLNPHGRKCFWIPR